MKKLLQIGAGKIGRSFIAQLFSQAGYAVVFADVDQNLVDTINKEKKYEVILKGNSSQNRIVVEHVSAINIQSQSDLNQAFKESSIVSISVGKNNLAKLGKPLAEAIGERYAISPEQPTDIILAENVRNAADVLRTAIQDHLKDVPLDTYIGFVETSIGKMVPLKQQNQSKYALSVAAEPYNNLILDSVAFRGPVPSIADIYPKDHIKAWVDRKLFIHNLGHSVLAYQSFYHYPDITYTWEALQHKELHSMTRKTMLQSAAVLHKIYHDDFLEKDLASHIDDLLIRFANKNLEDTIFRVGCDLPRKLAADDRLMIPILTAISLNMPYDLLLDAWIKGCSFSATDESGQLFQSDQLFIKKYVQDPIRILKEHCILDKHSEEILIEKIPELLNQIRK